MHFDEGGKGISCCKFAQRYILGAVCVVCVLWGAVLLLLVVILGCNRCVECFHVTSKHYLKSRNPRTEFPLNWLQTSSSELTPLRDLDG